MARTIDKDAANRPVRISDGRPIPASLRTRLAAPEFRNKLHTVVVALQILIGGAIFLLAAPRLEGDVLALAILIALNMAAERWPISIYGDTQLSIGFVLTMAIVILFGVPGLVIAAPFETLAGRIGQRSMDLLALRSVARNIIICACGAAVYGLIAPTNPDDLSFDMYAGAAFATIVCFLVSAILLSLSVWLRTGEPFPSIWERQIWVAPHFCAMGVLGVGLATAYIAIDVAGVLVFSMPAVMIRLAMIQYVNKTAENVEKLKQQNSALQAANIEIRRVSEELQVSYDGTLEALVNALDARDQETKGHSIRVSHYMMDIARELGVKEGSQDWIDMQRGSLLHDVGKIGVSDTILLKPGKLTEEEWELMRKHPEIGYHMLRQVQFLQGAAEIILGHHERWDGKGYPRGLHEDEIPLGSRIFPVVDTFDSMTSDRPYRKAKSTLEAMNEIMRCSNTQFDPRVVEAFLDIYSVWAKAREELHRESLLAAA
jgi:putative nucleotidyltransferase with HDIG domain